jgi:Na+-translocating ferredoxin:NAD+ oxidoreductase subunit G
MRHSGRVRRALMGWTVAAVLLAASSLTADHVYWETAALLADFFPGASRVTYERVALTGEDRVAVERATGRRLERTDWIVFVALGQAGEVVGYAVFDEQMGQHQPITFAVQFDPQGVVVRQELVVYREPYGAAIESARFRAQFAGKGPGARYEDVATVTGATISSQAMRIGVQRVVEVVARLLATRPGELLARVD